MELLHLDLDILGLVSGDCIRYLEYANRPSPRSTPPKSVNQLRFARVDSPLKRAQSYEWQELCRIDGTKSSTLGVADLEPNGIDPGFYFPLYQMAD